MVIVVVIAAAKNNEVRAVFQPATWCYNYTKMALTRAAKWLRFTYGKREFFALFCIPRVLRGRK
jgi:hypothetical protein